MNASDLGPSKPELSGNRGLQVVLCVFFTMLSLQAWDLLLKYTHSRVKLVLEDYKEIFEAVPFPDKKR